MITSILVPVDGSAHALAAVELASDLAQKYDARLTLVHVMTELGSGRVPDELRDLARLEHVDLTDSDLLKGVATRILDDAERKAREKGFRRTETVLEAGDPGQRIVDLAKERKADLIVMGRRGLGDLRGLLLGSVSHKVAQLAGCACLTVK